MRRDPDTAPPRKRGEVMASKGKKLPPELASLADDYEVTFAASGWILECKRCERAWSLARPAEGRIRAGNILRLLDHAASHEDNHDTRL